MFTPARKSMPVIDYVSIVRSVYSDRRALASGALASMLAAGSAALHAHSWPLLAITVLFGLTGILRYLNMLAFWKADVASNDGDGAEYWELRATVGGGLAAVVYGAWCYSSLILVDDAFAQVASISLTIAVMVGLVARNFGLDRLLSTQSILIAIPMAAGLLMKGDPEYAVLAALLLIMLVNFRKLAADTRAILLSAVHGRVEASRLAQELDAALDTMQHGLCMLDEHGLIAVANDRVLATFSELAPGKWLGRPFRDFLARAADSSKIPRATADELLRSLDLQEGSKILLRLADERYYEITVSSRQQRTVLLFDDVTARIKVEERITFMARYDALTGLPNRGYFTEQVDADLKRWSDSKVRDMVTLMIIDVDDFKHVNDTQGHLIGDRLLVDAAARIRQALGAKSLLARLGGDEFIVYRGGAKSAEQVMGDAQAVLAAFRAPFDLIGEHLSVNVSIGMVSSSHRDDDLSVLMTKADLALYKSKAGGKAQSQMFHDDMDVEYRYRQRLKAELRECVANDGLTLNYQPVIDLKTRRVVGCEALARWHHPELGTIPPSVFIPIAEESGLITDITRWVLMTATAECQNWPDEVHIAVNISAKDLRSGDVAQMVSTALASSGLPPHRLEIEVTETAVIEEREAAIMIFKTLAAQGIGIALDDFGTGYSSLSYLQALPFTKLKIDRSFVIDITNNPRSMTLLSNVAQLGKDIGLTVTAEGIETEDQLALIAQHTKVDQIQGYLFGVPLPRRDVFELIVRMAARPPVELPKRKHG